MDAALHAAMAADLETVAMPDLGEALTFYADNTGGGTAGLIGIFEEPVLEDAVEDDGEHALWDCRVLMRASVLAAAIGRPARAGDGLTYGGTLLPGLVGKRLVARRVTPDSGDGVWLDCEVVSAASRMARGEDQEATR